MTLATNKFSSYPAPYCLLAAQDFAQGERGLPCECCLAFEVKCLGGSHPPRSMQLNEDSLKLFGHEMVKAIKAFEEGDEKYQLFIFCLVLFAVTTTAALPIANQFNLFGDAGNFIIPPVITILAYITGKYSSLFLVTCNRYSKPLFQTKVHIKSALIVAQPKVVPVTPAKSNASLVDSQRRQLVEQQV